MLLARAHHRLGRGRRRRGSMVFASKLATAMSAVLLLAGLALHPLAASAAGNCQTSTGPTSYTVTVCITAPTNGAPVSNAVAASSTISVNGIATNQIQRGNFYLS